MATAKKPTCKYGSTCFRKNPKHFEEYSHPKGKDDGDKIDSLDKEEKSNYGAYNQVIASADSRKRRSSDAVTPPKKKGKIDHFFKKQNSAGANIPKKENEEKKHGNVSGYVRPSNDQENEDKNSEVKTSEEDDEDGNLDIKENIKKKFLVEMPQDFFDFWDFASTINKKKPEEAFKTTLDLVLVGPFDVLAGKCRKENSKGNRPNYLLHWRYFYDPPEFMTLVKGDDEIQYHMGYMRDDPKEMPAFVASNSARNNCLIKPVGENLFGAFRTFINGMLDEKKGNKMELKQLRTSIETFAKKKNYPIEPKTKKMRDREKKVNCKTFHNAGMVVPVDANDVGYREVPETTADLKKMFKRIADAPDEESRNKAFDPLMEIIMLVQFANDECDYGEGLELGLDLFSYGSDKLHSTILNLLPMAYQLLGRDEYVQIIQAHLSNRSHSADLNQLS